MYKCPDCGCELLELVYERATISRRGRYFPGDLIFVLEKETKIEENGELVEMRCTKQECGYTGDPKEFNTESQETDNGWTIYMREENECTEDLNGT